MTGPFHGATLVSFNTLCAAIIAHMTTKKYHSYVRDHSYMVVPIRARSGAIAAAEVTERVMEVVGVDLLQDGFTLTVETIAPVVTWKTVYDRHRVKITFDHA